MIQYLKNLVVLFLILLGNIVYSQVHHLFKNDSSFICKLSDKQFGTERYHGIYGIDSKEKLPDGKYYYYDISDSTEKSWNQHLMMEG